MLKTIKQVKILNRKGVNNPPSTLSPVELYIHVIHLSWHKCLMINWYLLLDPTRGDKLVGWVDIKNIKIG